MTIIPKTIALLYANGVKHHAEKELTKLQDPIKLLGYTSLESTVQGCYTGLAQGVSTQVTCIYTLKAYRAIAQDPQSKANLNANATKLQSLLQQNGWQGEYNETGSYTSLKKLVSSIDSNVDYQPDAAYDKQAGKVKCLIDSTTAFSSPSPPAIATQIFCTRTFNILGTPQFK